MIFAAGLGTRLRPITDTVPKALVPVNGKPLLHHLLVKLQQAGCSYVVINVHHLAHLIKEYIATHDYGMHIVISDESEQLLDTGGGLRHAASLFRGDEPILVHNADILSNIDLKQLLTAHTPDRLATVVTSERESSRYLFFDENNLLKGWCNTKSGELKPCNLDVTRLRKSAFAGIHVVSPHIFTLMQPQPDKFSIINFYLDMMDSHSIASYTPHNFAMLDVGKIDSLAAAEQFISTL